MSRFKKKNNFLVLCVILLSLLCLPIANPMTTNTTNKTNLSPDIEIHLDYTNKKGIINSYAEINCGPKPLLKYNLEKNADLTKRYQEIGITHVRTHDLDNNIYPCDISTIFPDQNADPLLESSYNFTLSDIYITSIINADCKVFYRLGESAGSRNEPPIDINKWAEVCKHVTMHYNDGWNNGYHYNISYWEIWNEPDLKGFWNGTAEQYYDLYETTVNKLKTYNSSLKIGGPCTSSIYDTNYTTRFIQIVIDNDLPLDFFSWHMYTENPNQMYTASKLIREILDSYGLKNTENINTEWNYNILSPQRDKDNAKNAAFTACALSCFQDAELNHSFRYRGNQDYNWLTRLIGFDLSLFSYDGLYKKPALSYLVMHYIKKDTPIRLTTPEIDVANGITYLAGISEDNTNLSFLISNYEADDTLFNLEIINLPWADQYNIVHYLIDITKNLEIIENIESSSNDYTINKTIKKNSVHFIRITNSTIIPDEGPEVADIPFILKLKILDPFTMLLGIFIFLLIFDI